MTGGRTTADPEPIMATAATRDTATDGYYQESVAGNQSLLEGGVRRITPVRIEWGPITVSGDTATAVTYETWATELADGTTEQSRDLNVFITFVVAGGVLLSGIAWIVDKVAAKSTSPAGEERLGRQLDPISYPSGGLLLDDITVLAQEVPGANDDQIRQLLRRGGR